MARVKRSEPATPEEIALLRRLEATEIEIGKLVAKKEDDVDRHNAGIKTAKADRYEVMKALEDYRAGVRGLPLDE